MKIGPTNFQIDRFFQCGLAGRDESGVKVFVIDTDPYPTTQEGGCWWDVAVPEVSQREQVNTARALYEAAVKERNAQW